MNGNSFRTGMGIAAGIILTASVTAVAGQAVNARTVAERMDKQKYTSSEIKTYLRGLKGRTITVDGRVHDVLIGKTGNRVVLHVDTPKPKDFVVDVFVDSAPKMRKNDSVICKGVYSRYNIFTVNGIILKGGSCSGKQ